MELDRKALLTALQLCEPALSSRDLLPVLTQFVFTGSVVRATDGIIGIEAPLETDISGGLPGRLLLGFVSSLDAEKIKAVTADSAVTFTAGRSKIKLPLEPTAGNAWAFSANAPPAVEVSLDAAWHEALQFAMLSVTNNTTQIERTGITFEASTKNLNLYATDAVSCTWAQMELPEGWEVERFTLPGDFVKQVLKLMPDSGTLAVRERSVEAIADNVRIHTRHLNVIDPANYSGVIGAHCADANLIPLPNGIRAALERAALLRDDKDTVPASFTFKSGQLTIEATASLGEVREELTLLEEHPETSLRATPGHLLRGLDGRQSISASERCFVLTGPDHLVYMVAAYRSSKGSGTQS